MRPVSNVTIASQAWAASIDKINEMAYLFSTVAVTVEANSTGAVTTGNAHIIGNFSATLIAADSFRGGNVSSAANLTISSNLIASSNAWFNGALVTVASNVVINGATTTVNALAAAGLSTLSTVNVTSTAELRGVTTLYANVIPTNNAAVVQIGRSTGRVQLFANVGNFSGDVTTTGNVNANSGVFTGNVTVTGDANVSGNLNVTGSITFTGTSASDFNPSANITYYLGNTTMAWLGIHTKGLLANSTNTIFRTNRVDLPASTNTIATVKITPSAVGGVGSLAAANGDVWVNATNTTYQELQIHIAGAVQNVAFKSSTVNAATQLETTRYIKLTGDASGSATFNGTSNADITVTIATVGTANNSAYLGGQLPAYYTDIAARLGYTALNKAGDTAIGALTFDGNVSPTSNSVNLGTVSKRWVIVGNTINLSGLATLSTANITGAAETRGVVTAYANVIPTNNTTNFGSTTARWVIVANTVAASGGFTGDLAGTAANATLLNNQAGSFYTNATNLDSGTVPDGRLPKANSTANGILMVLDSVTNTSITVAASANSVKRAYDYAATIAGTAYSNAISFSANATNLGNGTVDVARLPTGSASDFRANVASKVLTTDGIWAAANVVSLVDGANVAVDMSSAINFQLTLAGNRHLDNPSNVKPGQSGVVALKQDATGSRTLAFGSNWKFAGGSDPVLSTTANAVDVLTYYCQNSTFICASVGKAFA